MLMAADEVLASQAFYSPEITSQNSIWPCVTARHTHSLLHKQPCTHSHVHTPCKLNLTSSVHLTAALALNICPSAAIPFHCSLLPAVENPSTMWFCYCMDIWSLIKMMWCNIRSMLLFYKYPCEECVPQDKCIQYENRVTHSIVHCRAKNTCWYFSTLTASEFTLRFWLSFNIFWALATILSQIQPEAQWKYFALLR